MINQNQNQNQNLSEAEKYARIYLSMTPGIGPRVFEFIKQRYNHNLKSLFTELQTNQILKLPNNISKTLITANRGLIKQEIIKQTHLALNWSEQINQNIIFNDQLDNNYPQLLKQIYDPPPILYI